MKTWGTLIGSVLILAALLGERWWRDAHSPKRPKASPETVAQEVLLGWCAERVLGRPLVAVAHDPERHPWIAPEKGADVVASLRPDWEPRGEVQVVAPVDRSFCAAYADGPDVSAKAELLERRLLSMGFVTTRDMSAGRGRWLSFRDPARDVEIEAVARPGQLAVTLDRLSAPAPDARTEAQRGPTPETVAN